jgi:uncharacterized membrane protein YkvA (DUF1232 family)
MPTSLNTSRARIRKNVALLRAVYADPCTPRAVRWLLGLSLFFLLSPIDLIPDFVPVLGHLDDLAVVPLLLAIAWKLVPPEVIAEHRGGLTSAQGQEGPSCPPLERGYHLSWR